MKKEYDLALLKKRPGKVKVAVKASEIEVSLKLSSELLAMLKTEAYDLETTFQKHVENILIRYVKAKLVNKTVKKLKAS